MENQNSVPSTPHRQPPCPKIKFRVLIIGRANAGKTSILQRLCDTTDSPVAYRGNKEVQLVPSMERGEHSIEDELVFSNHDGYIFHDSRGFEAGSNQELAIVQEFIRRRSRKKLLRSRLHAIWYCVPMDNHRPELDLKYFKDICPDQNVPVIAVFTKYDQFLRNVTMDLEDYGNPDDNQSAAAGRQFKEHYLRHLGDGARFVRLEKMHISEISCNALLKETAEALNDDVIALMLLALQRKNLELSVNFAVKCVTHIGFDKKNTRHVVKTCLFAFPQIWADVKLLSFFELIDEGKVSRHNPWRFSRPSARQKEDFDDLDRDDDLKEVMKFDFFEKIMKSKISIKFMLSFFDEKKS